MIVISGDALRKINMSEQELLINFACFLYEKKQLSMGKARSIAGLNLIEFQMELKKRDIYVHYSKEDLEVDLQSLGIDL